MDIGGASLQGGADAGHSSNPHLLVTESAMSPYKKGQVSIGRNIFPVDACLFLYGGRVSYIFKKI